MLIALNGNCPIYLWLVLACYLSEKNYFCFYRSKVHYSAFFRYSNYVLGDNQEIIVSM